MWEMNVGGRKPIFYILGIIKNEVQTTLGNKLDTFHIYQKRKKEIVVIKTNDYNYFIVKCFLVLLS